MNTPRFGEPPLTNAPWAGSGGKRAGIEAHDVLLLNRDILKKAGEQWTDESIRQRTQELANAIIAIWPVPANHKSDFSHKKPRLRKKIDLSDLIAAGALESGMSLFPRRKKHGHRIGTLLRDGQVEVDGVAFSSPTEAASAIAGKRTGGWWFFLTDQVTRRSLRDVRSEYVNAMSVDAEDDELDDDAEEDEG